MGLIAKLIEKRESITSLLIAAETSDSIFVGQALTRGGKENLERLAYCICESLENLDESAIRDTEPTHAH